MMLEIKKKHSFETFKRNYIDDRAFHVKFLSEGSYDSGGPYRELFDTVCRELMSSVLPILIPSPN